MSAALQAGMGMLTAVAEKAGPMALNAVGKVVEQVHSGIKVTAHVEFDGPGPFDANVDLVFQGRQDGIHFKIEKFSVETALPALVSRTGK